MEFRKPGWAHILAAAVALSCIWLETVGAIALSASDPPEQRLDDVCLAVLFPGEAWRVERLDRQLSAALVLRRIEILLSAVDREHGQTRFDVSLRAQRNPSEKTAGTLFLAVKKAGETIGQCKLEVVAEEAGEEILRSSLTIPVAQFQSMCSEPPVPSIAIWLETPPTPTPVPTTPARTAAPAEEAVSASAESASSSAYVGTATARQLSRPVEKLVSPAEFNLPLPKGLGRLQPSQYWPSEALAGLVCDDVSIKAIRVWKRKQTESSAVYEIEFDVYVRETRDKLVSIDYSVRKESIQLGAGHIVDGDCEEDRTTTLRGRMELPAAEFEAAFANGSRPALVIVLNVKEN